MRHGPNNTRQLRLQERVEGDPDTFGRFSVLVDVLDFTEVFPAAAAASGLVSVSYDVQAGVGPEQLGYFALPMSISPITTPLIEGPQPRTPHRNSVSTGNSSSTDSSRRNCVALRRARARCSCR